MNIDLWSNVRCATHNSGPDHCDWPQLALMLHCSSPSNLVLKIKWKISRNFQLPETDFYVTKNVFIRILLVPRIVPHSALGFNLILSNWTLQHKAVSCILLILSSDTLDMTQAPVVLWLRVTLFTTAQCHQCNKKCYLEVHCNLLNITLSDLVQLMVTGHI